MILDDVFGFDIRPPLVGWERGCCLPGEGLIRLHFCQRVVLTELQVKEFIEDPRRMLLG